MVEYLLDHGAKVDVKDDGGKTALDAAKGDGPVPPGRQGIVTLLASAQGRN